MKIITAITAAALGAACIATPALARDRVERVTYHDLDLTTPEGQAKLDTRLKRAAWRVCQDDEQGRVRSLDMQRACYRYTRQDMAVQMAQRVAVADTQFGG
ncbi:UrcA family protein [Altererythrobacter sp. B11]|uniref:UrcA family protein n=1 Tax=Altererythrobacter sp. B11 TaxID=2060312 RepID=UPI000DC70471|nr:UrcA family protein [Altererythrobacter sp. B11]BBC71479.1 UrcA family protein [Altererythrobacter sp. B11]